MADEFRMSEGEDLPKGNGEEFDPNEMSLDDIDSLLSTDDPSAFDFDSIPVTDSSEEDGFEKKSDLLGGEDHDPFGDLESTSDFTTEDLSINLNELDEEVHLDEDFDFELSDPLIDAEIDRLLDIDEEEESGSVPTSAASSPSWKSSSSPAETPSEESTEAFSDLGSLDLGDFSQPGEVPASAFHSEEEPFDSEDHETGFSDLEFEDESQISLSDDELQNIDISSNLADFDMSEEEAGSPHAGEAAVEDDFLSDDEGPISLSDNELNHLLEEESAPSSSDLSLDELEHLLTEEEKTSEFDFGSEDLKVEEEPATEASADFLSSDASEEPIALSDDELGNLLSSGEDQGPEAMSLEDLEISEELKPEELSDFSFDPDAIDLREKSEPAPVDFDFGADLDEPVLGHDSNSHEEPISLPVNEFGDFDSEVVSEENDPFAPRMLEEGEETIPPASDFLSSDDSEEPIALSDDELGDLLSSGGEEGELAPPKEESEEEFLSDSDAEEPIALSDEELGDLLSSGEEETSEIKTPETGFDDLAFADLGQLEGEETSPSKSELFSEEEPEEPIALSDDELGDLLSSGGEGEETPVPEESDFFADAEEPIALSEDELGNLLSEGEEESVTDRDVSPEGEDTPISIPVDELEELGEPLPEVQSDYEVDWDGPVADLSDLSSEEHAAPSDWDLGEEAEEPITLSDDELGNLLAEEEGEPAGLPETGVSDLEELLSEPPPASDLDALGGSGEEELIPDFPFPEESIPAAELNELVPTIESFPPDPDLLIVLDEFADEDELSPIEEIRQTAEPEVAASSSALTEEGEVQPTQEEMKRILLYLDELLGNLPDDMIREFSRSDYFELYKKLMKQIGV
ncbi:hypothetical protein EHO60_10245 [Leptospira fletcheri]|uniref:Uncharacterized protein n=1 Tax=Leptospira fletcheri TaxID=2484981 RepID=A0A4R9GFV4_9LEPT|nr:hypothetical protein [Leptospira fletcheri]TGK10216.1 hypothetical protein EHO60_10245 [Leptospira fletcheri]